VKLRFNVAGPCIEGMHYMIPPAGRLPEAPGLVDQLAYFVVHAPRQTGKTTALRALAQSLTASGKYAALTFSCEDGGAWSDQMGGAQRAVLRALNLRAEGALPPELRPPPLSFQGDEGLIAAHLTDWARRCPRPIVLLMDEIDSLSGDSLLTVLRQLRTGFPERPREFPASIILCGLRDVRDYKAASGGDPRRLSTASPFNVMLESLRLGDFTSEEMRALYGQHTAATGQVWSEEAIACAFEATQGQPWLVNALAREIVEKMAVPPAEAIAAAHVEQAKERLILARATHLDSLVARLAEPRVKRFIEPVLAGTMDGPGDVYDDDLQYCRDLGLLSARNPIRIANPIYKEVTARVLADSVEGKVLAEPRSFVKPDGRLDFTRILQEFADFWREHGDILAASLTYHEVAPQLVLMAFLQRVVNGGGYIDREYGIGRGRIDLLIRWPYRDAAGAKAWQREALELKVWRDRQKDPLEKGLAQLDGYLDKAALTTGVLVIFDRRTGAEDIESRTRFEEAMTPAGRTVTLLRA
jgi:AAA domain